MTLSYKRRFLFSSSLVIGGLALSCAAQARPGSPNASKVIRSIEVVPGVRYFMGESALGSSENRNFISNAGYIMTKQGVVVVDALGSPQLAREMIADIRQHSKLPIRFLIVTHYHADHIYGLQEFARLGVTILAHGQANAYLSSTTAQARLEESRKTLAPWINDSTQLLGPTRFLEGDETLHLGGIKIEILFLGPAHTPEDLVVVLPQRGIAFVGDLVFQRRIPFVGNADSKRWLSAIQRIQGLKPRILIPGHGPMSQNADEDLQLTSGYLHYLRDSLRPFAQRLEPFEDAYRQIDWSRFENLPLFRFANRMNAFNVYLQLESETP